LGKVRGPHDPRRSRQAHARGHSAFIRLAPPASWRARSTDSEGSSRWAGSRTPSGDGMSRGGRRSRWRVCSKQAIGQNCRAVTRVPASWPVACWC